MLRSCSGCCRWSCTMRSGLIWRSSSIIWTSACVRSTRPSSRSRSCSARCQSNATSSRRKTTSPTPNSSRWWAPPFSLFSRLALGQTIQPQVFARHLRPVQAPTVHCVTSCQPLDVMDAVCERSPSLLTVCMLSSSLLSWVVPEVFLLAVTC